MLDVTTYQNDAVSVNSTTPTPLKGRYLSRSLKGRHEGAFASADLYCGTKYLVEPSLQQAALITGNEVSAVWWAVHRLPFREAIIAGELPLIPPHNRKGSNLPATNGTALAAPDTPPSSASISLLDAVTRGWSLMNDLEREEAVRQFGVAATWDALSRVIA
jgi:hypothetical protein